MREFLLHHRTAAAAPDLLAELRRAVDYLDCIPESAAGGDDEARAIVLRARALIARVEE